jgi:hypothetical protein
MAAPSKVTPASATVINPSIISPNEFFFSKALLPQFQNITISAGSSLFAELGSSVAAMPFLALGIHGAIDSINFYFTSTASDINGEAWELHIIPSWLSWSFPTTDTAVDQHRYMRFDTVDDANKVIDRTQPASIATVETLMNMQHDGSATLTDAVGSESTNTEPCRMVTCSQYVQIDIVAGATDDITLNSLQIWGTYREV